MQVSDANRISFAWWRRAAKALLGPRLTASIRKLLQQPERLSSGPLETFTPSFQGVHFSRDQPIILEGPATFTKPVGTDIVASIFSEIEPIDKTLVEITNETESMESKTLLSKGWTKLYPPDSAAHTNGQQKVLCADSAARVLLEEGVPTQFDLLIVDVGFNDFHVLQAVFNAFRPRAVIVAYNSSLGPEQDLVVPHRPGAAWDGTDYFGASFAAFSSLARAHGYDVICCDSNGVNMALAQNGLWPHPIVDGPGAFRAPRYGAQGSGHPKSRIERPYLSARHYLLDGVATVETKFGRISYLKRDMYIGRTFEQGGYWDEASIGRISQHLSTDRGLCLDIGAHIGSHSVALSALNPRLNFICFEPQLPLFLLLERNICENGLESRICARHCAVGHRSGRCQLAASIFDEDSMANRTLDYSSDEFINLGGMQIGVGGAEVDMIAIDSLSLPRVVYVKMDVEGAEPLVISGMKNTLIDNRPCVHYEDRDDRRVDFDLIAGLDVPAEIKTISVTESLKTLGYRVEKMGLDFFATAGRAAHEGAIPVFQGGATGVPKLIFQTWKSKVDMPRNFELWSSTFLQKNPNYEWIIWDDVDNREFISNNFPWFLKTYDSYPAEIYRADAVRYFFLYTYGGLYADLDVECLKPLDDVLSSGDVILGRMGPDPSNINSVPNAIMACKPRQEFWLLAMGLLEERASQKNARPESATGPGVLKSAVDIYLAEDQRRSTVVDRIVRRLPRELLPMPGPSRLNLLKSREWYPIDWTDPLHERVRQTVLKGKMLSDAEKKELFPYSSLVTYWSHSWE